MKPNTAAAREAWPPLPFESWKETCDTLHMWTQIVGKIRLALTPRTNHWWNVPLYVTARGLTTSLIPYAGKGFELTFDFVDHQLVLAAADGARDAVPLVARPVAEFYADVMRMMQAAGIEVRIWRRPVEVPDPIPFDEDRVHASYDPGAAQRFWRILLGVQGVFDVFRARFVGKCSPVHFFWGSFDLAVTRFSGRPAPERPGADRIFREAYSHEVSSVGFWPGGAGVAGPAFYSYTAPEPAGFRDFPVRPATARYDTQLGEFVLAYEEVRAAAAPEEVLLAFCQSTYEAGATLGGWDRAALERQPQRGVIPDSGRTVL